MKILVVNAGSSSLKAKLINTATKEEMASFTCERIGINGSFYKYETPRTGKIKVEVDIPEHGKAVKILFDNLVDEKLGCLKSLDEIDAIGHRVVNGGSIFPDATLVSEINIQKLEAITKLAPLHIPGHIKGIRACINAMPNKPNVMVFDTEFHTTMPEESYTYAIPYDLTQKYELRKRGAHGSSHRYIANTVANMVGGLEGKCLVSCHIGSGSSITAIKDGKCMDTTMGYTPLAGIPMGTRCGDIDLSVATEIMKIKNMTPDEANTFFNKECGMLGLTGSVDMRDIEGAMDTDPRCNLAMRILSQAITQRIGGYAFMMGGLDYIVFTAGVGENSPILRKMILSKLKAFGIELDEAQNDIIWRGKQGEITTKNSKVKVFVIPTNEEIQIATETEQLLKSSK